jgi:hypothetical protein
MTLYDVLIDIRASLIIALESKNREMADQVFSTLATLRDSAYEHNAEQQAIVIVDLLDVARDIVGGVFFKAEIPSVEAILEAFPPSQEAS